MILVFWRLAYFPKQNGFQFAVPNLVNTKANEINRRYLLTIAKNGLLEKYNAIHFLTS